jgi:LmbE family N-acetylglucosaminyl deacetylase
MKEFRIDAIRSILCLGAHADDLEIGCGGTILEILTRRPGIDVHWVVFSANDIRAQEAQASAEHFLAAAGRKRIALQDYRDTYFPAAYESIKQYFEEIKRDVAPDLVFTHRREDLHQDHRLIADLTWCAFRDHVILEYEIPKYEGDLGAPNFFVPLEEAVCRRKIEAILASFPSQQNKQWFSADTYWALLRLRGVECNSPTRYAEAFHCRKVRINWASPFEKRNCSL